MGHHRGDIAGPGIAVLALVILWAWNEGNSHGAQHAKPTPAPRPPEIITHTVTRVVAAHPLLSGDQVVAIVAIICAALVVLGVNCAFRLRGR